MYVSFDATLHGAANFGGDSVGVGVRTQCRLTLQYVRRAAWLIINMRTFLLFWDRGLKIKTNNRKTFLRFDSATTIR